GDHVRKGDLLQVDVVDGQAAAAQASVEDVLAGHAHGVESYLAAAQLRDGQHAAVDLAEHYGPAGTGRILGAAGGDDPHVEAAREGVERSGTHGGGGAQVELAGGGRGEHLGAAGEVLEVHRDVLLGEVAALDGDEDPRRGADGQDADGHAGGRRLAAGRGRRRGEHGNRGRQRP